MMFQDLTDAYEAMIDWPKRLAHETPFYRRWFESGNVKSVVDVACGTGRHAALFHSWQLRVEGADLSPAMIARARGNFGEPPGLRWVVRGFDEPIAPTEPFDAAVCVGNSLALAPDTATVERALREMLAAVRSSGLIVVHVLNLWHLPDGPFVWQKCQPAVLPEGEAFLVKGVHRCGTRGYVELLVGAPGGEKGDSPHLCDDQRCASVPAFGPFRQMGTVPFFPHMRHESLPLLGLEARELEALFRSAGTTAVHVFGGYQDQPYDRQASPDLVMVAEKR
jgi:SAM-dependent methyltransferase